jgi:hypothetical protein
MPGPEVDHTPEPHEQARESLRQPRVRVAAVVALVVAAVVVAWAVIGTGSSSKPSTTTSVNPVGPVGLSAGELRTLAAADGQPIYWAGAKHGYVYELTKTASRNVFVRYLPPGAKVGAKGANFLIIATYPFTNALQALEKVANGRAIPLPDGGMAVVDQKYPKSVHLAYPNVNYQVEVYDPSPARSLQVARSGAVRPVH